MTQGRYLELLRCGPGQLAIAVLLGPILTHIKRDLAPPSLPGAIATGIALTNFTHIGDVKASDLGHGLIREAQGEKLAGFLGRGHGNRPPVITERGFSSPFLFWGRVPVRSIWASSTVRM